MELSLAELAQQLGADLDGDPNYRVNGIESLESAEPSHIAFLASGKYQDQLLASQAGAVIVARDFAEQLSCHVLRVDDPYLSFARVSQLFDDRVPFNKGIHPSAAIDSSAVLGEGVCVGPNAVIGARAEIGDGCDIGAGAVVGHDAVLGCDCVIHANVTLYHKVQLGDRVRIQSGTVIGSDGFGFAPDSGRWERIAQLGKVILGDDVQIGSNTSIDRGALENTVIGDNVIIDNLVHIAHNVKIGSGSAIAGCVGIAGSTTIGKHCIFAGGVAIAGHLTICDGVQLNGMAMITNSIHEPGSYSSGTGFLPTSVWRRCVGRFKQLDSLAKRLQKLEKSQEGKA